MSTLAYARLTTKREEARPGTSSAGAPPGVKSYVDAVAALVPAEVLSLHAVMLSFTTQTKDRVVTITQPSALSGAFVGLLVLSVVLYLLPRFRVWDRLDYLRTCIPPLAFVVWTMLQRATAFDAVYPTLGDVPRTMIALFAAVFLGLLAAMLAYGADRKEPTPQQ